MSALPAITRELLPTDNNTYRKYYKRNNGASWSVVTLDEWKYFHRQDLWQVEYHSWGTTACSEFPYQAIQFAYERGLASAGREINPYKGAEAVAWLRGLYDSDLTSKTVGRDDPINFDAAAASTTSYLAIHHKRKAARRAKSRTTPRKKVHPSIIKHPANIDEFGKAWGEMMRYQPNGWYTIGGIQRWIDRETEGKNFVTRKAPKPEYDEDVEPSRRTGNSVGRGQKELRSHHRSEPLIEWSMPENILPYHIAWTKLRPLFCQAILWTHYVSDVEQIEKLRLLNVDGNTYRKWLAVAQRKIQQEICEIPEPAPEPPEVEPGLGPLWPCRIFGSVHKGSASDPGVSFPKSPLFDGPRRPIAEDENNNYVFRLPTAEVYAVVSKWHFNRFSRNEKTEFLDAAFVLFNEGRPLPT